MSLGSDF